MYLLSNVAYTIVNVQNKYKLSSYDTEKKNDVANVAAFISKKGWPPIITKASFKFDYWGNYIS